MTMSEVEYREVDELIRRAAKAAHAPDDIIPYDDLVQELWEFWLTRTALQEHPENSQFYILRREARTIAAKERVDFAYFTGAYTYTPNTVRHLLKEETWVDVEDCNDIEGRVDVLQAMKGLSAKDQTILEAAYRINMYPRMSKSQQRNVQRAVDKLAAILNRKAPVKLEDSHQVARQGG